MSKAFIEDIRLYELGLVVNEIRARKPAGCSLLEVGAGTGFQARHLVEHGYDVKAIDVRESNHLEARVCPIQNYDGKTIPFADQSFDVVFSSSVLEHILHVEEFQKEIGRVLKPDGLAIHVVPGAGWVLWTAITHYPFVLKTLAGLILGRSDNTPAEGMISGGQQEERISRLSGKEVFMRALMPQRHGERGTWVSELYYFSKGKWRKLFESTGWRIEKYIPNRLFYSGYLVFGEILPIETRVRLSRLLGSVCHVFVLTRSL